MHENANPLIKSHILMISISQTTILSFPPLIHNILDILHFLTMIFS